MIIEGNKIWLFVSWLIEKGVSRWTIEDALRRNRKGKISSWRHRVHPEDKRIKLIDYSSLPDSTKAKLPSQSEIISLAQAQTTESKLDQLEEACITLEQLFQDNCLISDYQFFLKRTSSASKAEDLKQASGWLRLLNKHKTPTETRKIGFDSKSKLRDAVVTQLLQDFKKRKGHLYGFKVTNLAVLQRKELTWSNAFEAAIEQHSKEPKLEAERLANEAALGTLVHENYGNNNRRILGKLNENEAERILLPSGKIDFSEWNASTLVYLFTNPGKANKYDFENIYRRYQVECKRAGRTPEVDLSAVKKFLSNKEVKLYTTRERHGWAEFDKMLPHVYGKRPEYALSKGGYDGFQIDFNSKIDGRQMMLTVVAFFDYMSEAITGFHVDIVEDGLMVRTAYRNHLNMMGGRSYYEIESDRFSGNLAEATQKIFSQTCQKITQPVPNDPQGKAPNPKARFVERLLQELNRLAQNVEGWKGTNITSIDRNRKPNPDYRNGNYVEGFAESKQLIINLINIYNNDTYNRKQSRMEQCMENINPKAPTIEHETIARLLNEHTTTTVRSAKILITVNRRDYEYAFPDFDQYAHLMKKGYKVDVYFDETNMDTVDVFGENDQYIGTLGKLDRRQRAIVEQTAEDAHAKGVMVSNRNKMAERMNTVSRKMLELWASELGVDISNLSIQDAQEVIAGIKHISIEELFAEALATPNAQLTRSYYEDRLLRANGEVVQVSHAEKKGLEDQRREHERERARRKGII